MHTIHIKLEDARDSLENCWLRGNLLLCQTTHGRVSVYDVSAPQGAPPVRVFDETTYDQSRFYADEKVLVNIHQLKAQSGENWAGCVYDFATGSKVSEFSVPWEVAGMSGEGEEGGRHFFSSGLLVGTGRTFACCADTLKRIHCVDVYTGELTSVDMCIGEKFQDLCFVPQEGAERLVFKRDDGTVVVYDFR